jgi:S-DNA-T family DNA segregation ATPase FtsK/SpoIIIE
VPGQNYIGIEVPNRNPSTVALRSVYESKGYYDQAQKKKSPLMIPLGRDVAGEPVGIDLSQMPHLLIAGTTGSGKSVCIAAMAAALVLDNTPDVVKMVMLDPKMVELSRFNGLPHLLGPVETDPERIIGVLRWCTREMDRRYKLLEEHASRNIEIYNSRLGRRRRDEFLPYIVVFIDEVGDLMMLQPDETEKTITRLAQMARAVGIHLIVATQRPSVDVITGLIKANFPSRISFAVASGTDSRVILDSVGAETLMGKGDMLYQASDAMAPRRLQGCFVSDDEVRAIVQHWKDWAEKEGVTIDQRSAPWERGLTRREFLSETDPMLEQAIELVIATQEASASMIQRRLNLGYPRAARIIDLLEELGVIGPQLPGARNRDVLIKPGSDPFKELIDRRLNESASPQPDYTDYDADGDEGYS